MKKLLTIMLTVALIVTLSLSAYAVLLPTYLKPMLWMMNSDLTALGYNPSTFGEPYPGAETVARIIPAVQAGSPTASAPSAALTWQSGQPANVTVDSGLFSDADGDGFPLILEASMGSNPVYAGQAQSPPALVNVNGVLGLKFDTNLNDVGETQVIEISEDNGQNFVTAGSQQYEFAVLGYANNPDGTENLGGTEYYKQGFSHQQWKTRIAIPTTPGTVLRLKISVP